MPKTGNLDDEKSISFTISAQSLRATKFFNGLFGVSLMETLSRDAASEFALLGKMEKS